MRNILGVPQTKYYYGSVKKRKCSFSCHLQIDEKINNINKNRSKRRNWFKLLCFKIPDKVVHWSTPWVVFLWRPIKVSLVCGFVPSLCMINLKKSFLFAPPGLTNYDKVTYIASSNLCLFTCPQATGFPWIPYPQRHISTKRVFLKLIPMSWC